MSLTRATGGRFVDVWRRCVSSPPSPAPDAVYADLRARLSSAGRDFHNLGHIDDCLRHLDDIAPRLTDPDAVEIALWFHDAVYEPGNSDNERLSAQLFLAQSKGARPQFRRRVCALILTTQRGRAPRSDDCKFIDDIDLAGFGSPWKDFMRNGRKLRREFSTQNDADYYKGLSKFLTALHRRPTFFRTGYFAERYGAQARANLDRLLALIAADGYAAK